MELNSGQGNMALKETNISNASEAHELARARTLEKQEQLCELSRALAVLASASVRICVQKILIVSIWLTACSLLRRIYIFVFLSF